jgi:DNA-directed RNA polymerase alpha subunit
MNSNYVMTLFESAEKIGLISTPAPFGTDIKISIPLSQKFCDKSIDDMDLSVRASNGLKSSGAMTVRELTDTIMSEKGLDTVRNLGKKSISEIKTKLLYLAYNELNDKEKQAFWNEFIELNSKCRTA